MARGFIPGGGGGQPGSDDVTAARTQVLSGYTAVTSDSEDEAAVGTMPDKSGSSQQAALDADTGNGHVRMRIPEVGYYDTEAHLYADYGSFGDAAATDVLSGKTFTSLEGLEQTGSIPSKAAATYNTSNTDQEIAPGQYLSGKQTIKAVTTSGISAGNIKKDAVVKVGDANDDDRITAVAGTYSTPSSGQNPITAAQVLSGYSGFVNGGGEVQGSIASKAAATYNTSENDQTIAAGQYLSGAQTIKAVTTENISAANIKKDVVVKVGDGNDAGRVKNITGTYTTVSSGQTAVTAGAMLSGYSGFANGGSEVKGSISSKAAATYNTSTSDQTISSGQYLSGAQTIKAVKTANIDAGNIKKGVVVKVGDANSDTRIKNVTGTYTTVSSGQSAVVAGALRSGYSGFANGGAEVKGTIANQAGGTYKSTTSNQTLSVSGKYMTSNIVITGDANLVAGNILSGKSILGVAGNVTKYGVLKNGDIAATTSATFSASTWSNSGSYSNRTFYQAKLTPDFNPVYGYGNITNSNDNYIFRVNWDGVTMSVGTSQSTSYNVKSSWAKSNCLFPFRASQSHTGCNVCGYY